MSDCQCGYGGYHEPENPLCPLNVSDQKPLMVISLMRHRETGNWYNVNLGWVSDPLVASLVSEEVHALVLKAVPFPERLELVKFVELPL